MPWKQFNIIVTLYFAIEVTNLIIRTKKKRKRMSEWLIPDVTLSVSK